VWTELQPCKPPTVICVKKENNLHPARTNPSKQLHPNAHSRPFQEPWVLQRLERNVRLAQERNLRPLLRLNPRACEKSINWLLTSILKHEFFFSEVVERSWCITGNNRARECSELSKSGKNGGDVKAYFKTLRVPSSIE
jgi:hypothetical protein